MIIKNAAMPAVDNLNPSKLIIAKGMIISNIADKITATDGTNFLKVMKTTIPMKINAKIIAIIISLKKDSPSEDPISCTE